MGASVCRVRWLLTAALLVGLLPFVWAGSFCGFDLRVCIWVRRLLVAKALCYCVRRHLPACPCEPPTGASTHLKLDASARLQEINRSSDKTGSATTIKSLVFIPLVCGYSFRTTGTANMCSRPFAGWISPDGSAASSDGRNRTQIEVL